MLCEQILGKISDEKFRGKRVDYVEIEWHEAFSKLHRKTSAEGEDVGIRMDNEVLHHGLQQDDVLYVDDEKVIAVDIPACEAIRAVVREDHPGQIAKLCYEVGNTHTTMFRGENPFTFYIPYYDTMFDKVNSIHGVSGEKLMMKFDFGKALSSTINNHHH